MNLFRSEEHVRRWPLYFRQADDYVLPISDWATVFSSSLFRRRLQPDYLSHVEEYVNDYRVALQATGKALPAEDRVLTTVLFTDIVDSTRRAASEGAEAWRQLLERHDEVVRDCLAHFGGREVKQTGDGFLASFQSPARAVRCALLVCERVRELGLEVRAGVHSGECEVRGDDLGGIAVHIGARIAGLAGAGEVLTSRTVVDAVTGSELAFEFRGAHALKGVPDDWEIHVAITPPAKPVR
jgi:class 3 adenylate cyclase